MLREDTWGRYPKKDVVDAVYARGFSAGLGMRLRVEEDSKTRLASEILNPHDGDGKKK